MIYNVKITFTVNSEDYAEPPDNKDDVNDLVYTMIDGGREWPDDIKIEVE